MGYRNDSEHLRHRVEQLEGQLETLRGKRGAGREATFDAKVKRQTLIIVVLAILGSLTALSCVLPAIAISLEEGEESLGSVVASRPYSQVTFRGTGNHNESFASATSLSDTFIPLQESPRILLLCSYGCPDELRAETNQPRELIEGEERVYQGRALGYYEYSSMLGVEFDSHLERHQLTADEIRVVELERVENPLLGLAVVMVMALMASLWLWAGLLWHRRASSREVPLPETGDFVTRDPGVTVILTIVTCRVYELIWMFLSTGQIRRITGRRDLNPGVDVLMTFATFGLWMFWVFYRNIEAVDDALTDLGEYSVERNTVIGLTLGSFLCGFLHWLLIYRIQESYNRLIVEKMTVDDLPDP